MLKFVSLQFLHLILVLKNPENVQQNETKPTLKKQKRTSQDHSSRFLRESTFEN